MLVDRELRRDEIALVWTIDRRESIDALYHLEDGKLILRPEQIEVPGWPPGEADKYTPILLECFDRGGWAYGAFEDGGLIGVVIVHGNFIGINKDQLQLEFLHVSRAHRKTGLGAKLFHLARAVARERGARSLYVSATPSRNTVNFYLRHGCRLAKEPEPELFAREPEDIHLECEL